MIGEDEIRMKMYMDVLVIVRRRGQWRRGERIVVVDAVMPFESTVDDTDGTGQRVFRLAQRRTHRGCECEDEEQINQTLLDKQFVEQKTQRDYRVNKQTYQHFTCRDLTSTRKIFRRNERISGSFFLFDRLPVRWANFPNE